MKLRASVWTCMLTLAALPLGCGIMDEAGSIEVLQTAHDAHGEDEADDGGVSECASPLLDVVGHVDIAFDEGHISDVWAYGNYAYVGSFYEPICTLDATGVHIVDISDPKNPHKVAYISSPPGSRANDVKVTHIETPWFRGELLVHTNEPCWYGFAPRIHAKGMAQIPAQDGIAMYDVTNPLRPRPMRLNFLDFPTHNTFIYQQGENAYMLVVDDVNARDVHIINISNPRNPREIAVTGAPDWPLRESIPNGDVFAHDIWVQENDVGTVIAYLSYWDAGLVMLDITDPANPAYMGNSVYATVDPISLKAPSGDGHVAVPSTDGQFVFMGDEDFSPFTPIFMFDGTSYPATEGLFTEPVSSLPGAEFSGTVIWTGESDGTGGEGCTEDAIPGALLDDQIALIQRGTCYFSEKGLNAQAKGYAGFVIANSAAEGDTLITMVAADNTITTTIPGFFVGNETGEDMKDLSPAGALWVGSEFNGWGYARILDVHDPTNIVEVGQFTVENVMADPPPPGDHTMHNVMVRDTTAYVSWYTDGIRVVDFSVPEAPTETACFIADGGSNFWGVYLHDHPDENTYILGSDRNSGLWIFETP